METIKELINKIAAYNPEKIAPIAKRDLIDDLRQLRSSLPTQQDEVAVPPYADDHIKEGLTMGASKVEIICCAESYSTAKPNDEFSIWFRKNEDLFIKALANGYTVEKEPLYYVKFPNVETNGYDSWLMKMDSHTFELADNNDFDSMQFTEQEIKAIDERYWEFAIPVEEETKLPQEIEVLDYLDEGSQ